MGKSIEVILLEDVKYLGRSGDTCKVRAGYARNFLFPKKQAITLTPGTRRLVERKKAEALERLVASKFCFIETSTVTNFLSLSFKRISADVSSSMCICIYMCIYTYKHTYKFITQMEAYWIYYFLHLEFSLDDIFW